MDFDTACQVISSNTLKFSLASNFNDPFDCDINVLKFDFNDPGPDVKKDLLEIKAMFPMLNLSKDEQAEMYREIQKEKVDNSAITCFSLEVHNTLLWSYYADKHKGVCLEFDNLQPDPFEGITIHDVAEGIVGYSYEIIDYCKDKKEGLRRLFLMKLEEWQHENEYRIILYRKPAGLYTFNKRFLTRVFFGLNIDPGQAIQLQRLCIDSGFGHVDFFQARKEKLRLRFQKGAYK